MYDIKEIVNTVVCGDTLSVLKTFPSECADTIITSPPYWGLRDYGEDTKTIWGGDKSCEHKWAIASKEITKGPAKGLIGLRGPSDKPSEIYTKEMKLSGSQLCSLCGAWYGQLGLEPTLDLFLEHLLEITAELKRVLKKTGVMFWNHGDCYGGSGMGTWKNPPEKINSKEIYHIPYGSNVPVRKNREMAKCLMGQNYRLLFRMIDEQNWIWRNQIIWHKPNAMPSSVKDRFANTYEPVFMLVKNNEPQYWYNPIGKMADKQPDYKNGIQGEDWEWGIRKGERIKLSLWQSVKYYFDLDAVRKPQKEVSIERLKRGVSEHHKYANLPHMGGGGGLNKPRLNIKFNYRVRDAEKKSEQCPQFKATKEEIENYPYWKGKNDTRLPDMTHPAGKNPGDCWTIPTQPFKGAHFATFPEKLIQPMILAGCPEQICKKCGKAQMRISERITEPTRPGRITGTGKSGKDNDPNKQLHTRDPQRHIIKDIKTIGWTDCGCNAGWNKGIVLDPFAGSGTTCLVAKKLGIRYIGIEISPAYCKMAEQRLNQIAESLF